MTRGPWNLRLSFAPSGVFRHGTVTGPVPGDQDLVLAQVVELLESRGQSARHLA